MVHIAMPLDQLERMSLPPDVIGKTIDLDPMPTLELAFRLHPDAKRLMLVSARPNGIAFGNGGSRRRGGSKAAPKSNTSPVFPRLTCCAGSRR